MADLRRMSRVRVGVQITSSRRLYLDGRVLGAAWGRTGDEWQRYLLLDVLAGGAVAVPESRLATTHSVGLASRDVQLLPALPNIDTFVAFSDAHDDLIAKALLELQPPPALAAVGRHVCSPDPRTSGKHEISPGNQ